MTIEKAHGILSNGLANAPSEHEWCVAFKMAIEALEALDKIRAEIQRLRGCSCYCSDGIIDDVEEILDKYKAEIESQEIEE